MYNVSRRHYIYYGSRGLFLVEDYCVIKNGNDMRKQRHLYTVVEAAEEAYRENRKMRIVEIHKDFIARK